jgi:hypothetical protein
MKKTMFILLAIAITSLFSFKEEKKLKVELSLQQWQIVVNTLDNSTSPHTQVKATTQWIAEQVQAQIDTTSKQKK